VQKAQDNESSSSSDDLESDNPGPSKRVAKKSRKKPTITQAPQKDSSSQSSGNEGEGNSSDSSKGSGGKDEDNSSESDSDLNDAMPSKTIVEMPVKSSKLKRSRCDDDTPTKNARPSKRVTKESEQYIFHKSYNESNEACTILAGNTYFKVFGLRSFAISQSLNTRNSLQIPRVLLTRPSKYFRANLAHVNPENDGLEGMSSAPPIDSFKVDESPEDVGALYWILTA